jgi:MOSC domain-containing protein YiiM/GNAT superfamily N-acetyltransferase
MATDASAQPTGRVLQVNISGGGVPKVPVERAWVSTLGLRGDEHDEKTVHGGPHQAVCLFGIEAIERLQSDGHPLEPGSVGENLTTTGVEWSLLPVGTRARIGERLEIELASAAMPCKTQTRNFKDGRFSRMSIALHPSDSRMYARVLTEGEVREGDPIAILPPAADSRAEELFLLKRLDRVSAKADIASWRAAKEAGFQIDIVEDGDISMASSVQIEGPAFNHAMGMTQYPNLIDMVTAFYDERHAPGWIWAEDPPWLNAEPEITVSTFAADPADIPDFDGPRGLTIRVIGPDDAAKFVSVYGDQMAASGVDEGGVNPWPQVYQRLAKWPHRWLFMAELDGKAVGSSSLHMHGTTGWLRGGVVAPEARGQGIQRALISARARAAIAKGCDLVGSWAEQEGPSATNLQRMGLNPIGTRRQYAYRPPGV